MGISQRNEVEEIEKQIGQTKRCLINIAKNLFEKNKVYIYIKVLGGVPLMTKSKT